MRLAYEETTIMIGDDRVRLRPSLRAAMRLEQTHGLPKVLKGLQDGSATIMADVIAFSADRRSDIPAILKKIEDRPFSAIHAMWCAPLLNHVIMAYGLADQGKEGEGGKHVTFEEYFAELFGIATGAMGWTPKQAWDASPSEIVAAYKGRQSLISDILKAAFGVSDQAEQTGPIEHNEDERRKGIATLKWMQATGANRDKRH